MPKYSVKNTTKSPLSVWSPAGSIVVASGKVGEVILTEEQFKATNAVSDLEFEKIGDDEPAGVAQSSFVSADDGKLKAELDSAKIEIDSLKADLDAAKKGLEHQDGVIAGLTKDLDAAKKAAEDKPKGNK